MKPIATVKATVHIEKYSTFSTDENYKLCIQLNERHIDVQVSEQQAKWLLEEIEREQAKPPTFRDER